MENKNFSNAERRLAQTVQPCPTCHCDGTIEGRRGRELQRRISDLEAALESVRDCGMLASCTSCRNVARAALAVADKESK